MCIYYDNSVVSVCPSVCKFPRQSKMPYFTCIRKKTKGKIADEKFIAFDKKFKLFYIFIFKFYKNQFFNQKSHLL